MSFVIGAAIIGAATSVATTVYAQKRAGRAQARARDEANLQRRIDGSAPNIANVGEVVAEDVQGSAAADISESLKAMDYLAEEEVPFPETEAMPNIDQLSEEQLAALMQQNPDMASGVGSALFASGGAVGTPEDVYYFGVPQIMGMMQDPNPQIQGVGMQLADQMSAMPDAGMVPATANQIQSMAYGGAVTAKKFEEGGATEPVPELVDFDTEIFEARIEDMLSGGTRQYDEKVEAMLDTPTQRMYKQFTKEINKAQQLADYSKDVTSRRTYDLEEQEKEGAGDLSFDLLSRIYPEASTLGGKGGNANLFLNYKTPRKVPGRPFDDTGHSVELQARLLTDPALEDKFYNTLGKVFDRTGVSYVDRKLRGGLESLFKMTQPEAYAANRGRMREEEQTPSFGPGSRSMANGGPITAQRYQDGTQGGMTYDPELDAEFIAQQEAFEELLELDGLVDNGVISEARAEHDRQLLMRQVFRQRGQKQDALTLSDSDRKNPAGSYYRKKAEGGLVSIKKFDNGGATATEEPYDFFSEEALRPILETEPSFRPEDPSLRQRGERAIAGLLGGEDFGKTDLRQGKKLMQVADMIPGLGDATAAADVYDDFKAGNNLAGGIGALAAGVGMIPGLGDIGAKGITTVGDKFSKALQKAQDGGFDISTPYFHGTHAGKNLNMVPEEQRLDNPILSEGFTSMGRPDNSRAYMSNDPRVANTYTLTSTFQDSLDQVQQPVMYPVFINKSNYIRFKHKDPSVDAPEYNKLILDTLVVEKPDGKGGVVTEEAVDYLRKLNPNGDVQKQLDAGFTNLQSSTNGIANLIEEVDKDLQPSGIIFEKINDPMSTLRGDLITEYKNKPEIIAKYQIKDPLHPDSNYLTIDDDAIAYADQEISKGSEVVISLDPKTVKGIFGKYEDLDSPDLMKAEGGRITSDRLNQLRLR